MKWHSSLLTVVAVSVVSVTGHVRLDFPVARDLPLDFMDNFRTPAPCGMPKGDSKTTFRTGAKFNVTWHLAYPHQGMTMYACLKLAFHGFPIEKGDHPAKGRGLQDTYFSDPMG